MKERTGNDTMRKSVYAWFALGELFSKGRRAYTLISIFCLFLVATTIGVFGFYAACAHREIKTGIMKGMPTRITAECPPDSLHDKSMWFNEGTMQRVRELNGVTSVFEKITMVATLTAPGAGSAAPELEGTVPDDPRLGEHQMLWGKNVSSEDCDEIVVSEALLHRIWPEFSKGKIPAAIQLSVERGSGVNRRFTRDFTLVGIAKGGTVDDAYLPIGFMESLELWCESAIEKLPEPGQGVPMPQIRYDSARVFAYGDSRQKQLEEEAKAKHLNISLRKASEPFRETYFDGSPFLVVSRGKNGYVAERDISSIRSGLSGEGGGVAVNAFCLLSDDIISEDMQITVRIKAVRLDDARLERDVPGSMKTAREALKKVGSVLVSEGLAAILPDSEIRRAGTGLSPRLSVTGTAGLWKDLGEFDIICSMETMSHFTTDISTKPRCMLWTSDPAVMRMLEKDFSDTIIKSQGPRARFSRDIRYRYGLNEQYYLCEYDTGKGSITTRFIPDGTFHCLAVPRRQNQSGDIPALVVLGSQPDCNGLMVDSDEFCVWAEENEIYVAGVFMGKNGDELWLPESAMKTERFLRKNASPSGYFAVDEPTVYVGRHEHEYEHFESNFCMAMIDKPRSEAIKYVESVKFEPFTIELVELQALPEKRIKFHNSGSERIFTPVLCDDPSIARLPFQWARNYASMEHNEMLISHYDYPYGNDNRRFTLGEYDILLGKVKDSSLPMGMMLVSRQFVASNTGFFFPPKSMLPVMAEVMLTEPDAEKYRKVLACLDGFSVKPLFTLKTRTLVCYDVMDSLSTDGKMDEKLVPILRSEPMFVDVCPNIAVKGSLVPARQGSGTEASDEFKVMGSHTGDMTMFMNGGLKEGGWLPESAEYSTVLPESALDELGIEPQFIVGKQVSLKFKRNNNQLEPGLNIETRVAGVVSGERGYIPVDLANKIILWQEGILNYNSDLGFIHPQEIYRSQGRLACNVYVEKIDDVRPVVAQLREMGYETEDSLAAQEDMIKIGISLISFVVLVVIGTLVLGTVNILVITWMNTRSKMFRMGILRSAGVSRLGIICIFIMMFLVVVGLAFISSTTFLGITEPGIRNILRGSGITIANYASGSILDFEFWWIHLLSLLVYSASAFVGMMFSACKVCRLRVCELFHDRDL